MAKKANGRAATSLTAVAGQRERLLAALIALEKAAARPTPRRAHAWMAGVTKKLDDTRIALAKHVQVTEEPGGLFEEVLERAPRMSGLVKQLRAEHDTLRTAIDELLAQLRDPGAEADQVPERARQQVISLLGLLSRHRQLGADLVYESYEHDLGGPD